MVTRNVIVDCETTGIGAKTNGICEIAAVEIVDRKLTGRFFHAYVNPQKDMHPQAQKVHGLTPEFLSDKPIFRQIARPFLEFVRGSVVVAHNAKFDVDFINEELARISDPNDPPVTLERYVDSVVDSMKIARKQHNGKANLDAVASRMGITVPNRDLHGALLDTLILADVYLRLTQRQLSFEKEVSLDLGPDSGDTISRSSADTPRIIRATDNELTAHEALLGELQIATRTGI